MAAPSPPRSLDTASAPGATPLPRAARALPVSPLAKAALALVVALLLVFAYRLGAFEQVKDPRRLAHGLRAMGPRGWLVFVLLYAVLQPFGVPGTVFVVAAPLIWPWATAFGLSMAGTMGASVVGFSFCRFVARDWVAAHVPERFHKYDEAIERHAMRTVFMLRLIFWMPQALHAFLAVSRVSFADHFWGSLLGYAAPLFMVSYFGARIFDGDGHFRVDAWPILAGMSLSSLGLAMTVRWVERSAERRRAAATSVRS